MQVSEQCWVRVGLFVQNGDVKKILNCLKENRTELFLNRIV